GHCLYAAVILITRPVEHDLRDAGGLRTLGDSLAHFGGLLRLLHRLDVEIADRRDRPIRRVIHQLRVDVLERAEHNEARTRPGARNVPADTDVTALALR